MIEELVAIVSAISTLIIMFVVPFILAGYVVRVLQVQGFDYWGIFIFIYAV